VISAPTSSDADGLIKALQEANMSTEIGLIFLDILSLYCTTFKVGHRSRSIGQICFFISILDLYTASYFFLLVPTIQRIVS